MIFWDGKGDRSRYQERELELLTLFYIGMAPFQIELSHSLYMAQVPKCTAKRPKILGLLYDLKHLNTIYGLVVIKG